MPIIAPLRSLPFALLFRIVALLFDTVAVMPVLTELRIVHVALMPLTIRVVSAMTARMTDITELLSLPLRILWLTRGMVWLTKELLSVPPAMTTDPDPGAEPPPIVLTGTLGRVVVAR